MRAGACETTVADLTSEATRGLLCVVVVSAVHLATIRDGQEWGDDFSMYIHHAENLAHRTPYAATGYIYNPHNPAVGPRVYPPGFPLLLAPVVKLFGPALLPMKVLVVASLAGCLLLLLHLSRGVLPSPHREGLVLITGLNPVVWDFKDRILADLPFLFFALASLACFAQAVSVEASARRRATYGALAGLLAYVSYETRVLGIVLGPTFLANDLVRHRRVAPPTLAACAVFAILGGVRHLVWPDDGSYFDQLTVTAASIGHNVVDYARALSDMWGNGYSDVARKVFFLAASALAALGYMKAVTPATRGWREVFPWLYLAPVILWPSYQGIRFLLPVIPFYLLYCLLGTRALDATRPRVFAGFAAAVALTYAGQYSTMPFGRFPSGVAQPESVQFFEFVKTGTDSSAVFVFSKPRALALYTGRRASAPFSPADPCELWGYIAQIGASYVVTGPDGLGFDVAYLHRFVDGYRDAFRPVWQGATLAAYRIVRNPCSPGASGR